MKKVIIAASTFLVIVIIVFLIFGRSQQKPTSIPVSTFLPVLEQQIDALNNEDIDSYLETIHEASPALERTKNLLIDQFENYDQVFELVSWEIVDATNDEIKVRVVQTVKNPEGSDKKDTKTTAIHILRKSGNSWKVYDTVIGKTEYLD